MRAQLNNQSQARWPPRPMGRHLPHGSRPGPAWLGGRPGPAACWLVRRAHDSEEVNA
jgi:hypothetical protein